jgi:beta-mannosidase
MWIAHATAMENVEGYPYVFRIKLMSSQVTTLFGETVPNTLCDFAKASQISQAEAKKYFIERTRVSKWRRTGIIWWNIMDGWPQISDAVVDYYFCKKLAYHYIKRSQNPLCLIFDEPENDGKAISLYAVNEHSENKKISYRVTDLTENKVVASGTGLGEGESSTLLCTVPIKPDEKHFYFIEWECNGEKGTNHYMTNIIDIDYKEYMGYIEKCGYDEFEGFGE